MVAQQKSAMEVVRRCKKLEAKVADTAHPRPKVRRGGNGSRRRKLSEIDWSGA